MSDKPERFELRLDKATLDRIDTWRSEQPDMPSRAESVRRLVSRSLNADNGRRIYETTRFQVLAAALTPGAKDLLPSSYVFAWDREVFPFLDAGARLHVPFEPYFRVGDEKADELSKFLDDRWTAKQVPTFYELEDHFEVRLGRSGWDRSKLISSCRYMYLNDLFDAAFWKTLLTPKEHPTEASTITRKYDPGKDLRLV
jgi:antitoxin MazE